ncbi:MAG TPA: hypothetical protein VGK94_08465 [Candidatus Polarisedimenticolia bacterium]|jgi:hypothetical protein
MKVTYDLTNGVLLIDRSVSIIDCASSQEIASDRGVIAISGFPPLFDTLLTFVPSGQALSILTPAHPEGFRSADSLQVWTGNVHTLPDWSQAQALTCSAAINPTPGQVVTVPDTLPAPAAGEGRYYIAAATHGLDRRLGRQSVNGILSARDPSSLPTCGP